MSRARENEILEELESLGEIGRTTKLRLIAGTFVKCSRIRQRAIEEFLPLTPDDELFSLDYLLTDRSKGPIKVYLRAIVDRNPQRAAELLLSRPALGDKTFTAIQELEAFLEERLGSEFVRQSYEFFAANGDHSRLPALKAIGDRWPDQRSRDFLTSWVNSDSWIRTFALRFMAEHWADSTTRQLVEQLVVQDEQYRCREEAIETLAENWPDDSTRDLLRERATREEEWIPRSGAVRELARWPDDETRNLLLDRAIEDTHEAVRRAAVRGLAEGFSDDGTYEFLRQRTIEDESRDVREAALWAMVRRWPNDANRARLIGIVRDDEETEHVRLVAKGLLERYWPETE